MFKYCQSVVFDSMIIQSIFRMTIINVDLPKLKTIVYGDNALEGDKKNYTGIISSQYKNKLMMKGNN